MLVSVELVGQIVLMPDLSSIDRRILIFVEQISMG